MKAKLNKGLIIGLVIVVVGGLVIYSLINKPVKTGETSKDTSTTENVTEDYQAVQYFLSELNFDEESDDYHFTIKINRNQNVLFPVTGNQKVYICVNLDGIIPDRVDQFDYPVFEIELKDGEIPEQYTINIDKKDNIFTGDSLTNLNNFMNGSLDHLNATIVLFNPNGELLSTNIHIIVH